MQNDGWLLLNDYSAKHNVSVSTLRRRIRSGKLEYRMTGGKYYLQDLPPNKSKYKKTLSPKKNERPAIVPSDKDLAAATPNQENDQNDFVTRKEMVKNLQGMISEIKNAYVLVLQEKEKALIQAKNEISDLNTLCRALELENDRLKSQQVTIPQPALNDWLDLE